MLSRWANSSGLFHKMGGHHHVTHTIDLAVQLVILALFEPLDNGFGAYLEYQRAAFNLEVFNHRYLITFRQQRSVGIFYRYGIFRFSFRGVPFVGTLRADEQALVLIDKLRLAVWARWA